VLRTRALTNASIGSRRYRVVACIQVEDDGPGVPAEIKDTVFYPLITGRQGGTASASRSLRTSSAATMA